MLKTQINNQTTEIDSHVNKLQALDILDRYKLQSNYVSWNEAEKTLTLTDLNKTPIKYDFRTFFFPPCAGAPFSTSVASNELMINTLLFQIDISLEKCGGKSKVRSQAVAQPIYIFMCVMTYFRNKGIYSLKKITSNDMKNLGEKLGQKNWHLVLNREKRWLEVIAELEEQDTDTELNELFFITKQGLIYGLKRGFWEKKIGYSACSTFCSNATKRRIAQYCEKRSYSYCKNFKKWLETEKQDSLITIISFRQQLQRINQLAVIHKDVDYLERIPFKPNEFSSQYFKGRNGGRTENLNLSDATYLLKRSFDIVFDDGPAFITLLKSIINQKYNVESQGINSDKRKESFRNLPQQQAINFLNKEKPFDILTSSMGLPPIRYWVPKTGQPNQDKVISLIELIGIIQSACCFVIIALNARRIGEVTDKATGLRTSDLSIIDEELGIYQCQFYIEKTYQERHHFYVNRSTASAIKLLIDMKAVLSEFTAKTDDANLFSICNPVPLIRSMLSRTSNLNIKSFYFNSPNSILSFFTLMRFLYPNSDWPIIKSHMGRRFFALIYFYRYDNADMLSLSQQLRHSDISMTNVYIKDPDFRDEGKNIASTIGKRKDVNLVDKKLYDSLELEFKGLEKEIEDVGKERLTDVITRIISGDESAGGFSRFIRKLFRSFAQDIKFVESSLEDQGLVLSERLQAQGYKPNCMPHGQCNAPESRGVFNAKCRNDKNETNKERACADLCRKCQYHYNNNGFLHNLEEDAKQLKQDMDDFMLPPLQQQRAQKDYDNLIHIIELNKQNMKKNRDLMMKTRMKLCE